MWGISWANVQLMLADSVRIHYEHSGSEKKDNEVMDLNNPKAIEKLMMMADAR